MASLTRLSSKSVSFVNYSVILELHYISHYNQHINTQLHHARLCPFSSRSFSNASNPISIFEPNTELPYDKLIRNLNIVRDELKRPLTLAEKIVYSHLDQPETVSTITRGESYLKLQPDRVAMQDASAQTAVLQFMLSGLPKSTVPATIHCDHYIRAFKGAAKDVAVANEENKEVQRFIHSIFLSFPI